MHQRPLHHRRRLGFLFVPALFQEASSMTTPRYGLARFLRGVLTGFTVAALLILLIVILVALIATIV